MPFCLDFSHTNPHMPGQAPVNKVPIKWSGLAARRFCALPAFKSYFWPFLQEVHAREGKGGTKRGYPAIPCATPWNTAHNSQSPHPKEPGSSILMAGPLALWGGGCGAGLGEHPRPN